MKHLLIPITILFITCGNRYQTPEDDITITSIDTAIVSNGSATVGCHWKVPEGWKIVYNKFYKDYAVVSTEWLSQDQTFLLNEGDGYGFYAPLERDNPYQKIYFNKSLFKDSCGAKKMLQTYLDWKENNKWE